MKKNKRFCVLCQQKIGKNKKGKKKVMNNHHLSYTLNVTIPVCYICHRLIHGRLPFRNPFERKYGKDHAGYIVAKRLVTLFELHANVIDEIKTKYGE